MGEPFEDPTQVMHDHALVGRIQFEKYLQAREFSSEYFGESKLVQAWPA